MGSLLGYYFSCFCRQFYCTARAGFNHILRFLINIYSGGSSSNILRLLASVSGKHLIKVGDKRISSSIFNVSKNCSSSVLYILACTSKCKGRFYSSNILYFLVYTNITLENLLSFSACNLLVFWMTT